MSVIVNTNVQSLIAQRNLGHSTDKLSKATERLSTGAKINHASDDAAGLFIAKGLEAQLSGSMQCKTNIALAINVLQIAEGDLSTIQDNIVRIKDLATQAASGVYSSASRNAIQSEIDFRLQEIDRIATSSSFNGFTLLDGNSALTNGLRIQVGCGSDDTRNAVTISSVFVSCKTTDIGLDTANVSVSTAAISAATIQFCEDAFNEITQRRTNIGVAQSRLEMAGEGLTTTIENISSAKSTIMDTDVAETTAEYTKQQILQQLSTAVLLQANQASQIALTLMQGG